MHEGDEPDPVAHLRNPNLLPGEARVRLLRGSLITPSTPGYTSTRLPATVDQM